MSRSNWSDLAKVVGLVGLACGFLWFLGDYTAGVGIFNYHHDPSHKKYRAIDAYCQRVEEIFLHQNPARKDGGGTDSGETDKKYEACQQWKATEANEKSAHFAKWQGVAAVVSTIIAFLTLLAAGAAAFFAMRAAKETGKAAKAAEQQAAQAHIATGHAKTSAEAELEGLKIERLLAQSAIEVRGGTIDPKCKGVTWGGSVYNNIEITFTVHNAGRVQASRPTFVVALSVHHGASNEPLASFSFKNSTISSIPGGQSDTFTIRDTYQYGPHEVAIRDIRDELITFRCLIGAVWRDVFDEVRRTDDFEFRGNLMDCVMRPRRVT